MKKALGQRDPRNKDVLIFKLRFPKELAAEILELAQSKERSFNQQVLHLIKKGMKNGQKAENSINTEEYRQQFNEIIRKQYSDGVKVSFSDNERNRTTE